MDGIDLQPTLGRDSKHVDIAKSKSITSKD